MTESKLPAGWAFPLLGRKFHYFPAGELRSLCMRWMLTGERLDAGDDFWQNCAECQRKVKKLRAVAAQTSETTGGAA